MGSRGEDRLGTGRNHRSTAQLDEYVRNLGKNRNNEDEGNAEKEGPRGFTRNPSIVSFPAGKLTDYDACHLGLSGAARVWVAKINGGLDGMMRSRDIAGASTI